MALSDFNGVCKLLQNLKAEKDQAFCENQELKSSLTQQETKIGQMLAANDTLIDELKIENRAVKDLKHVIGNLENCIHAKEEEICFIEKQIEKVKTLRCEIEELRGNLERQNNENSCLEENIAGLLSLIHEKDCKIGCLKGSVVALEEEARELECAMKSYAEQSECVAKDLDECQSQLERIREEHAGLSAELEASKETKREVAKTVARIRGEVDALENEKTGGRQIAAAIKETRNEIYKIKMENDYFAKENCEIKERVDANRNKVKQCLVEFQQVFDECKKFKREVTRSKGLILSGCNSVATRKRY